MSSDTNQRITLDEIEAVTQAALERHGATSKVAAQVAHAVRVAEGNGNRICGLYYLESYCRQLLSGRVSGTVEPVVRHERPGAVRVDAQFGFAQAAFAAGLDTAVEAAKTNGVCGYAIEHSHTCTSLGYFTEQLAMAGVIALGSTNSTARVSPPGGSQPVLGTNPFAMAVPDGQGGLAFQFDFSTSAVALGKITMAAAAGESIPIGWAVDADGNDTTDPKAALEGSLVSAGGYKGYGMGLMVEVLASALTGSLASTDLAPLKAPTGPPHNIGQFYLLVDPEAFSGTNFHRAVDALAQSIAEQEGARLPGSQRVTPDAVAVPAELWEASRQMTGDPVGLLCPVCGYDSLSHYPWTFETPSHEVCASCGTHFGHDDADAVSAGPAELAARHGQLRARWKEDGSKWWSSSTEPPAGWDADAQLQHLLAKIADGS